MPHLNTQNPLPPLYRHRIRPQWGLAVIAWERRTKRAYQFEDGKLRVIKKGFYRLLDEVDIPRGRAAELATRLRRQAGVSVARREMLNRSRAKGKHVVTLKDQLAAFGIRFPGGFAGDNWQQKQRGLDQKRTLKRHRNSAIERAATTWTAERLTKMSSAEIIASWRDVLASTDLVTKKHLAPLDSIAPEKVALVAEAFLGLLFSEDAIEVRINRLTRLVGEASWELVTTPLMLRYPKQYIAIRLTSFKKQAAWMAPRLEPRKRPSGKQYLRFVEMATRLADRIKQTGLEAQDMIDLYDFIRISLLPSTLKLLGEESEEETTQPAQDIAA